MDFDLQRAIAGDESELVEFKLRTSNGLMGEAARTLAAMLNGRGGSVVFGVTPGLVVEGQEVTDLTLRKLWGYLEQIQPGVTPRVETQDVSAGTKVLVVTVTRGPQRPYRVKGVAYKRVGSSTVALSEPEAQALGLEAAHGAHRWESERDTSFTMDDLDVDEVMRTARRAVDTGRLRPLAESDPETLLTGLGVMVDGNLTRAAAVLFGQEAFLDRAFPQCRVRLARFRGDDKSEFVDHRQEAGNVFRLLGEADAFLRRNLPVAGRIVGGVFERQDDPVYPPEALREALANAFVHRDYTQGGGSVSVAIYDDRLEIGSPGGLHFGLTVEDLYRSHESRPWNPTIAKVLYLRGMIETWGRGTIRMAELTRAVGLPRPEFEELSSSLTVRFRPDLYVPPEKVGRELSDRQRNILRVLANAGPSGAALSGVLTKLAVETSERRAVQLDLVLLRQLGLVASHGHARGARWVLVGELSNGSDGKRS